MRACQDPTTIDWIADALALGGSLPVSWQSLAVPAMGNWPFAQHCSSVVVVSLSRSQLRVSESQHPAMFSFTAPVDRCVV